jgi:hypothetical protein
MLNDLEKLMSHYYWLERNTPDQGDKDYFRGVGEGLNKAWKLQRGDMTVEEIMDA